MKKRVIQETVSSVTDLKTGEAVSQSSTKILQFPVEPPFVKMYVNDLCSIVGVGDADQALLRHLLARLDYEGFVALTSRSRASICTSLGVEPKTLRNRLNKLVKADLIKNVAVNEYRVNPNFFARGEWKSVCEQRQSYVLKVTYSESGRTIESAPIDGDRHLEQELF